METVKVGDKAIPMSRIVLGTWAIGGWMWGGTDEKESIDTIRTAVDQGITTIDTAPVYGHGKSEEIVGKAIAEGGLRDTVQISTKAGLEWDDSGVYRNATEGRIIWELEQSLKRLQTDHIDIYFIHWPDSLVPTSISALAMQRLYEDGKIGAVGVSNHNVDQMELFRGVAPLHIIQPPYNLFERGIDDDVLPYADKFGVSVMAYGVLCRGLLSGNVDETRVWKGDDLRQDDPKFQGDRFKQYLAAVEALDQFAQENYNKNVIHLAARWTLQQPGISSAIWGARNPEQLEPVSDVFDWELSQADMDMIDSILREHIKDPVGPEFMAPPTRREQ